MPGLPSIDGRPLKNEQCSPPNTGSDEDSRSKRSVSLRQWEEIQEMLPRCRRTGGTTPAGGILESLAELKEEIEELDDLSNSVVALIEDEKWEEAEAVCHKLRQDRPERVLNA